MYEYNNETKTLTLTLNEWGDIRFLPSDIKKEAEHLICNDRKRITSDIYFTRGLMELCMLKDVLICDENPAYKTVDGIVYSKDGSKLLFCPAGITGHVRVLDGTKIIFKNSFTSSQISEITIPDSVEMIDDAAFASSISLEHVYFSKGSKLRGYNSYRTVAQYPGESNNLKNATVRLVDDILYVPKMKKGMKLIIHRNLPENAHICNVTLSLDTDGHFYASIAFSYVMQMEMDLRNLAITGGTLPENLTFLGLDYSQTDFYVDSEGKKANYPHYYRKSEEKLGKLQARLAKKQKGSSNYKKLQAKIQKLHAKIKNQRNDFLQQESTRLVRKYDVIAVEDIDLRAMGGALKLGKNLHDNGFGMFRAMLAYKLEQKGSCLVKVDRWFASTKTCSHCGHVQKVSLDERTYVCEECGFTIDRDWNAAINIREEGKRIFLDYFKTLIEEKQAAA